MANATNNQSETVEQFINYLNSKGYDKKLIYVSNYRNPEERNSEWYKRVEIRYKGKIIQAFVIMPESDRNDLPEKKYPFYRSYKQKAAKNVIVNPACYVATISKSENCSENWDIYSCTCLDYKFDEKMVQRIVNYKEARKSFFKRWNSVPSINMSIWLRIVSLIIAFAGVFSLLFYKNLGLSSENLFPIGVLTSVFVVLAAIAPCVNTLKINGTVISWSDDDE